MSFIHISKVEPAQKILDFAFKRAAKVSVKKSKVEVLERVRRAEAARLDVIFDSVHSQFSRIIREFPGLDNLTEFYSELLNVSVDFDKLKKGLGAVNWADKKAKELLIIHKKKGREAKSSTALVNMRKSFMGRLSSVVLQVDPNLSYLDECRKIMKEFPVIKSAFTVCIAGFPNVGKSTLLGRITTSKPVIKDYAFTTKTLNLGYFKLKDLLVQVIDTPGTLARPEKMNNIEKQAYLAIKYQADVVVFIFDPTDTYSVAQQEELLRLVKAFKKPVIIYVSKSDIAAPERVNPLILEHSALQSVKELLVAIEDSLTEE
jgi:nucleolar GTP-binding protein